jgi:hypothetical protein
LSILLWLFWRWGISQTIAWAVLNLDPLDLSLLTS